MTEHLRRVLAQVEQLDPDTQETIADTIEAKLAEIAEAQWQAAFADPRSQAFFDELIAQADAAVANGTTRDLDDLLKTVA